MGKLKHKECPKCGAPLTEIMGKHPALKCSTNNSAEDPGCGFILWINYLGGAHTFTAEEIDALMSGERIVIDCVSKQGKNYKREVYFNDRFEVAYDEPFINEPQEGTFL